MTAKWFKVVGNDNVATIRSLMAPAISHRHLPLHPPQSLFLILPFFWPPRPKPDFLTSPTNCLFLARSFFMPPPCRNCCFWFFLRCFRICWLVFSSERIFRPPGVCCGVADLWKLGPPRPRPRPRPDTWTIQKRGFRERIHRYLEGMCGLKSSITCDVTYLSAWKINQTSHSNVWRLKYQYTNVISACYGLPKCQTILLHNNISSSTIAPVSLAQRLKRATKNFSDSPQPPYWFLYWLKKGERLDSFTGACSQIVCNPSEQFPLLPVQYFNQFSRLEFSKCQIVVLKPRWYIFRMYQDNFKCKYLFELSVDFINRTVHQMCKAELKPWNLLISEFFRRQDISHCLFYPLMGRNASSLGRFSARRHSSVHSHHRKVPAFYLCGFRDLLKPHKEAPFLALYQSFSSMKK